MATEQQLMEGIRRADAAGDGAGVKALGAELLRIRGTKPKAEAPAPKDDSAANGFLGGVLKPLDNLVGYASHIPGFDAVDRLGTAMGLPSANAATAGNERLRQNNSRTGYQTLGNIAGTLPTMALPGGAMAQGAASGALLTDKKTATGVALDSGIGAVGSKLAGAAADGLAWAAKPVVSQTAKVLHDAGIDLTLGQLARGGKGLAARTIAGLEDRAAGLPIIGNVINVARGRGTEQLNKKLAGDALASIGEKLPSKINIGHELLDHVEERLSERYKQVVPRLVGHLDKDFIDEMATIKSANITLPKTQQKQFDAIIKAAYETRMDQGRRSISGQALKDAETSLGEKIRNYSKSSMAAERELASALADARQALRGMAARSDKSGSELQNVNKGWAQLKQLQGSANLEGEVTPTAMLRQSIKTGWGKELARAAQKTLPNKIPDSGTAGRVMAGQMLLGGGGALGGAAGVLSPQVAIPLAAAGLTYSKLGGRALNQFVFRKTGAASGVASKALQGAAKLAPVVIPPLLRAR